jgi:hypothetical protein
VCLDDNACAVEVGIRLQETLADRPDARLCVRIKTRESLEEVLKFPPRTGPVIIPFGMVEDACCDQAFRREYNEALARVIHENFIHQRLGDSIRTPATDPALQPWERLRDDFRESNRQQADHIAIKLRAIGCQLVPATAAGDAVSQFIPAEMELLARMEHERWNAERWLAGWHYGAPSNKPRRISENLVSWNELHESIRDYDREAVALIPVLLAGAGRKVIRSADLKS